MLCPQKKNKSFCVIFFTILKSKWLCGFKSLQYRLCDGCKPCWYFSLSVLSQEIKCGRSTTSIKNDFIFKINFGDFYFGLSVILLYNSFSFYCCSLPPLLLLLFLFAPQQTPSAQRSKKYNLILQRSRGNWKSDLKLFQSERDDILKKHISAEREEMKRERNQLRLWNTSWRTRIPAL